MRTSGVFPVRWAPKDGEKGQGVTIKSTSVRYAASTSGTSHPTSGWKDTVPTVSNGNYLWTWTHVEYSDDTTTDAYSVSRMGIDGKGIQSSKVTYSQQKDNVSPESITDWGTFPSKLTDGYWLYTKTHIVYSDNSATDSYSVAQVGVGSYYAGVSEYYKAGSSADKVPDGAPKSGTYVNGQTISTSWDTKHPTLTEAEPYLWNFEVSYDSRGNKYVTEARCIGNFAKGIKSIVEAYALSNSGSLGANGEPAITGTWTDEPQDCAPTSAYPYQWNKTTVTYNNDDTDVTYHVSAVRGDDGKGSVYIDLDNENDTMLYNQAGTLISDPCVSNISLYDNGKKVSNPPSFAITERSSGVSASVSVSVLKTTGITSNSGYVIVGCTYNGVPYTARFTVKRLVVIDKYDLGLSVNSITLNTSDGTLSDNTIKISVFRTGQNASRSRLATANNISTYGITAKIIPNGVGSTSYLLTFDNTGYANYAISEANARAWNNFAVVLLKDNVEVDRETVPINKVENGPQGKGGVVLDFDNDNDTMLYDGAGNLLSGNSVSQGTLLEGGDDVTTSVTKWEIAETTGGVSATISDSGKVTTTGITQTSGTVKVRATYNGKYYYAVITIKRLVGVDKFDIECSPNAITYNSTTKQASASSVKIKVYRTGQNGQRTLVQSLSLYHLTLRGYTDNSDNYTTVLTGRYNSGVSLIVYPDTYSQYRFELVDKDDKVLDSETIPISKTANGDSGRGIVSQTSYFTATDKATLAKKTDISDSYWSTAFPTTQVTEQQPYVWKSVYTVYTSGNPTWSTPELVATYRAGINQNLLENAAFRDDSHMGAWNVKSKYSSSSLKDDYTGSHIITSKNTSLPAGKNNRNYYHDTTKYRQSEAAYKECLQQLLYDTATKKLQPNTWYTLSFWYKCGSTSMSINQTSNGYGFATQKLYLVAGHKYVLFIAGYISQTAKDKGKKLRVHIYRDNAGDNNWSWGNNGKQAGVPFVDIDNVGSAVENRCTIGGSGCDFGEVPQTGEYLLSAYLYPNDSDRSTVDYGTATFSYVRMHDLTAQADTYVYPSCVDTNSPAYVDGVEVKAPSDMAVAIDGEQWNDGGGNQVWKRRIITFKTKSISGSQYVLWRLLPSPISGQQVFLSVCMPKLEEGMFSTGFVDTYEDTEGLQGCLLRDFIWQEGYECHNDEKLASWPRYLDIAYIEESVGVWKVYQCLQTHKASADKKPGTSGGASYWKVVDNMGPLYTPLLLADNAKIKIGQTNQFLITDSDNNIVGCLQGDISKPIFYIQEPQSETGISMGVDDHGNPYIKGNSRDVEQDNNTDYAFLLDPARGIFDFYGPSSQHFCVNDKGLSYSDSWGSQFGVSDNGFIYFNGQDASFADVLSVEINLDGFRFVQRTSDNNMIAHRKVSIDDKGYLKVNMDDIDVYYKDTKKWTTFDAEHFFSFKWN